MLREKPSMRGPEISDFGSHKEDQSILSMMVKRDCLKTYPYPDAHGDTSDVYAIEAGYCDPGVQAGVMINTPLREPKSPHSYQTANFTVRRRWYLPDAENHYIAYWKYN